MNINIDLGKNEIRLLESVTVLELVDFMKEHNFNLEEWTILGNLNVRHTEIFPIYIPQSPTIPANPYWRDNVIYCGQ